MKKTVLILGATGAMGTYLVPELLNRGYSVTGVSLDEAVSDHEDLTYIKADATKPEVLENLMKTHYSAVVDFMIYETIESFSRVYKLFLENTDHYVFLSTYRVYGKDMPLTEKSPRLLDIDRPDDYVCYKDYSTYKAQAEDFLHSCGYKNFTIVRPAITFSKRRFQLTILEADIFIQRARMGKKVVLPEQAMDVQATMNWAGDVAKMFAAIIEKPEQSMGETYTLATAEHHTWREIAQMYHRIEGLEYVTMDTENYIQMVGNGSPYTRQQLLYDRCYDRVVDNRKILELMGAEQSDLMGLEEGLAMELKNLDVKDIRFNEKLSQRMDEYIASIENN